jgi:hypothetical protein
VIELACYLHFRLSFLAKRRAWFPRYLPICSPLISAISRISNFERVHHFRRWDDLSFFSNPTIVGRAALHRTGGIVFSFVFFLYISRAQGLSEIVHRLSFLGRRRGFLTLFY